MSNASLVINCIDYNNIIFKFASIRLLIKFQMASKKLNNDVNIYVKNFEAIKDFFVKSKKLNGLSNRFTFVLKNKIVSSFSENNSSLVYVYNAFMKFIESEYSSMHEMHKSSDYFLREQHIRKNVKNYLLMPLYRNKKFKVLKKIINVNHDIILYPHYSKHMHEYSVLDLMELSASDNNEELFCFLLKILLENVAKIPYDNESFIEFFGGIKNKKYKKIIYDKVKDVNKNKINCQFLELINSITI